jgi:hypothetical protein
MNVLRATVPPNKQCMDTYTNDVTSLKCCVRCRVLIVRAIVVVVCAMSCATGDCGCCACDVVCHGAVVVIVWLDGDSYGIVPAHNPMTQGRSTACVYSLDS